MAGAACQWQNAHARRCPPARAARRAVTTRDERGATVPRTRQRAKTRRALARGGRGAAHRLNETLGAWPGVKITPMFGRWGYFVGDRLFACFPLAPKDVDLWIRLDAADQARALREPGVRPHPRFARRGWIEIAVTSGADMPQALRWLRRAHATATADGRRDGEGEGDGRDGALAQ